MVHLIIFVLFGLIFKEKEQIPITRYKSHYAQLLTLAIGTPPIEETAHEIARVYSVQIRYEGPEGHKNKSWTTWDELPSIDVVRRQLKLKGPDSLLYYDVLDNPDGSAFLYKWQLAANIFSGEKYILIGEHVSSNQRHIIILLTMATLAFIGAFLFILWVLASIKKLRKGVNRITDGHLDVEVQVNRNDELGHLAFAFNQMSRRIKEMIKSRDQLLMDVSHELRSPITRIKVALELMPDHEKKEGVRADLSELETMITEILESERMKNGRLQITLCDMGQLLKETVAGYEKRQPGVQFPYDEQPLMVRIDEGRIKIVLQNILENAVKYSNPGSRPVQISIKYQHKTLSVWVLDDGMGIPGEELPFLFEPFYRVDRSRSKKTGGYGLGLSMCKKIMTAHKGDIRITNNEGNGMTVQLTLPLAEDVGKK